MHLPRVARRSSEGKNGFIEENEEEGMDPVVIVEDFIYIQLIFLVCSKMLCLLIKPCYDFRFLLQFFLFEKRTQSRCSERAIHENGKVLS